MQLAGLYALANLTLVSVLCLGTPAAAAASQSASPSNPQLANPAIEAKVDALVRQMTLEEKTGQLTQFASNILTGPGFSRKPDEELIRSEQVGSLLGVVGAAEVNRLQHIAVENTRLHIPLIFGFDVIHGERTIFPVPLALASSFDTELVEQAAHTAATEAREDGIDWVFSPMVDIARDARWGRIVESAGEDPFLSSAMARAYVQGYQQNDLGKPDSVAACVKHFAAYGAVVAGRDYNTVDMSETQLRQVYLRPYHAAVEAGSATVMTSFNLLNGIPSTANAHLLTEILRHDWGFDGFVVSDWGAVGELIPHGIAENSSDAARVALLAGNDMDMESGAYLQNLPDLVRSGKVPQSAVDEAVRRVLRVKFALGLFEHPYAPDSGHAPLITPARRELARRAAEESFVLLKNDAVTGKPLLPLNGGTGKIALIGPLADSKADMLGSWDAAGNPKDAVTLRESLKQRLGDRVVYAKGTDILTQSRDGFAAALSAAQAADTVILALGESGPSMSGEATSRAHLGLPGNQEQLLEAVAATGKPIVLVLFNGRPLALPWAAAHVPAMLEAWFPGIEAGPALAATLFGDVSPGGKLTVEFPYSVGQEPLYLSQLPVGRPAGNVDLTHPPTNGTEKYPSRYIDSPNAPVFPFGWGLSYTSFTFSKPTLEPNPATGGLSVRFTVTNTGNMQSAEVAQLYVRRKVAPLAQPVRELKGFERFVLAPHAQREITIRLRPEDLVFYNGDKAETNIDGSFDVWVGDSSLTQNGAEFNLIGGRLTP